MQCESCQYYDYDEQEDVYYCTMSLDEDDAEKLMTGRTASCPYYKYYDEYKMVEKQN